MQNANENMSFLNFFGWETLHEYFVELFRHKKILLIISVVYLTVGAAAFFLLYRPTYTAAAIIGPASDASASSYLFGGGQAQSGSAGLAQKLLGGAGSKGDSQFNLYMQILSSNSMKEVLLKRYNILHVLNPHGWDEKGRRIGSHLFPSLGGGEPSDMEVLSSILEKRLRITEAADSSSSQKTLMSGSSYKKLLFSASDPDTAVKVLNLIISVTDNIIRENFKENANMRISYLLKHADNNMNSDQRAAYINVLSSQMQMQVFVFADKFFSMSLIDAPYAPSTPATKNVPRNFFVTDIVLILFSWVVLVFFSRKITWLKNVV